MHIIKSGDDRGVFFGEKPINAAVTLYLVLGDCMTDTVVTTTMHPSVGDA